MPELKSKKSGRTWKDAQSFYNDYIQADPSAKDYNPNDLWEAARASGGYDFADKTPQQPMATQPPPATPGKPFSPVQMLKNLPGSFAKQAQEMGSGAVAAFKYLDPLMINPTDNMYAQAVKSINEKGVSGATQSGFQTAGNVLGAVKDQYKDRYFNGKFLENLENDPAAIAADVASVLPVAGWAAKTAGMAKTAKTIGKIGAVADAVSSPIPLASGAISRAPMIGTNIAKKGMKYALQLPKELHETKLINGHRPPSYADNAAQFALDEGFTQTKKGQRQADKTYLSSLGKMKQLENDATNSGVTVDKSAVRAAATKGVRTGNEVLSKTTQDAFDALDEILSDPANFGPYPIATPDAASNMRTRLNQSTPPKPGVIRNESEGMKKQVEVATGDAIREVLGDLIPGQREAAKRAMMSKQLADSYTNISAGRANKGIIENAQPGALGLASGNILKGQVMSPVVMGLGAKYLHGPELVSTAASKIYSKSPTSLRRLDRKVRKPAQYGGQVLKQVGKPNPLRPFAEDDEPRQANPLRPFPEE